MKIDNQKCEHENWISPTNVQSKLSETEREKDSWKIYRSKRDFVKAEMTVALQNVLCHVVVCPFLFSITVEQIDKIDS